MQLGNKGINDDFRRDVGTGSRQQGLVGDFVRSLTSSMVTLLNKDKVYSGGLSSIGRAEEY